MIATGRPFPRAVIDPALMRWMGGVCVPLAEDGLADGAAFATIPVGLAAVAVGGFVFPLALEALGCGPTIASAGCSAWPPPGRKLERTTVVPSL
ncbi:MAG: hypothetical protein ABIR38_08640 [Chthoniobacterales bacterium]